MPNCSVLWCKNRTVIQTKTYSNITYHRFPKNPSTKQTWIQATGRSTDWIPTTYSAICSIHFVPSLFMKSKNGLRTYLEEGASPTLYLPFYVKTNENLPTSSLLSTETLNVNVSQDYVVNMDSHHTKKAATPTLHLPFYDDGADEEISKSSLGVKSESESELVELSPKPTSQLFEPVGKRKPETINESITTDDNKKDKIYSRNAGEDEFDIFGNLISVQLRNMPKIEAIHSIAIQEDIQSVVKKYRLRLATNSTSNTSEIQSSLYLIDKYEVPSPTNS